MLLNFDKQLNHALNACMMYVLDVCDGWARQNRGSIKSIYFKTNNLALLILMGKFKILETKNVTLFFKINSHWYYWSKLHGKIFKGL